MRKPMFFKLMILCLVIITQFACRKEEIIKGGEILSKSKESMTNLSAVKPRMKGFVLRGDGSGVVGERNFFDNPNTSPYNFGNYVDGIVVQAEWATLQNSANGAIVENNVIDQAIEAITLWNENNPNNKIYIKLRVFAGIHSPRWVSDITGGCMVYYKNNKEGMLPRYWYKKKFWPLWEDFQNKLAAKYDHIDIIREVAISGAMTHNAETMWRNPGDDTSRPDGRTNIEVMMENGLTVAKDKAALKWQVLAALNAWQKTRVGIALNMWKDYEDGWQNDPIFVTELINYCLEVGGNRVIIGNNSIGLSDANNDDANDPDDVLFYIRKAEKEHGALTYVQTETIADDIHVPINYAVRMFDADMAELPKLKSMDKFDPNYLSGNAMQNARTNLKQ